MKSQTLLQFQERTDEKLRYAQIHLMELKEYANATSNDEWEKAHLESCIFQLYGSVDGLLQEINEGYSLGLDLKDVGWNQIENKLKETNRSSQEFNYLNELKNNKKSWLSLLKEWRNHGIHRSRINKIIKLSNGTSKRDNELIDPRSKHPQTVYPGLGSVEVLENLVKEVKNLIDYCRSEDKNLSLSQEVSRET